MNFSDMFDSLIFDMEMDSEDKDVLYFSYPNSFINMVENIPVDEMGIRFCGEVKISDKISVLTDKKVSFENSKEVVNTYQKVLEIRELTDEEKMEINKFRLFFKKLFEVFFRNDKWRVYYTLFVSGAIGLDIYTDNYFGVFIMALCIALNTSPIKFAKEIKKLFFSESKKKKIEEYLKEKNVLNYVNSIDDGNIRLYLKTKDHSFF